MRTLICDGEREIGFPQRKYCEDKQKFLKMVNLYNKVRNIYFSLYKFNNTNRVHYDFDKVFFDFDIDDDKDKKAVEKLVKDIINFTEYLSSSNVKHLICFSGKKGFHVYIFTTNYKNLKNPKEALYNAQKYFSDMLNLEVDKHVMGDIARISRVPNTWHLGGKRYCIPILKNDLYKGWEHIKEKAKEQNFKFKYYGKEFLDLKDFDFQTNTYQVSKEMPKIDYKIKVNDKIVDRFLPCVKMWLTEKEMGTWEARYNFVVFCREMGLPPEVCDEIAKKYFSKMPRTDKYKNNYRHFKAVKCLEYGYKKVDYLFPNCVTLFQKGLCKGKCEHFNKMYANGNGVADE